MKVDRNFASSDRSMIAEGEPGSVAGAGASYAAAARVGAQVQDASIKFAQKQVKRDAAVIVADQLSQIQEETSKDYLAAQSNVASSTDNLDPDKGIQDVSLLVNMPGTEVNADYNKKPFSEYVLSSYDERLKKRLENIKNPLARAELQKRGAYFRGTLGNEALSFEARATLDLRKELIGTSAERFGRMTLQAPQMFDDNLAQINTFVDNAKIGAEGPKTKAKYANDLALSAAEGWIANDPQTAKKMLDEGKESFVQHLTPQQIVALKNKNEGRMAQVLAEERQVVNDMESAHRDSLLETGRGIPEFEKRVSKAYADRPEILSQKLSQYKVWESAYEHKSVMDRLPIGELDSYIQKHRPASGDTEYDTKAKVTEYLGTLANKQIEDARKDPAHLAEVVSPDELEKIPAANNRQRALFRLSIQEQKGIPEYSQRLLTNSERAGLVTAIQSAPVDQILSVIQDMGQQYDAGGPLDKPLSPRLFKELTAKDGLDPSYSVLLQNVQDGSPVAFDLVRTMKIKDELKKNLTDKNDQDKLRSVIDSRMGNFSEAFLFGNASNLEQVGQLREVAYNLSNMYMVEKGMSIKEAGTRAVDQLVNQKIGRIEGALIIPQVVQDGGEKIQLNPEKVLGGLDKIKGDLLAGKMDFGKELTFGGAPKWMVKDHKDDLIGEAMKHGYWKTSSDFTGAVYMIPFVGGELPLLDKKGNNFYVPFTQTNNSAPRKEFERTQIVYG